MSNVTRAERKKQRQAQQKRLKNPNVIAPVEQNSLNKGHTYWLCGYYWDHDMVLVEPFRALWNFDQWHIIDHSVQSMDFYEAEKLVKGSGTMLVFEDRVAAIKACDAIDNEKVLLDSFEGYMTNDELVQYLNSKDGAKGGD